MNNAKKEEDSSIDLETTAILIIDPQNYFLSEGGSSMGSGRRRGSKK